MTNRTFRGPGTLGRHYVPLEPTLGYTEVGKAALATAWVSPGGPQLGRTHVSEGTL